MPNQLEEITTSGIYHLMPEAEYRKAPGLSNSAMKDLAVSPLRFWHRQINPNRTIDPPTPEMQFGTAVHCAVLEPEQFNSRFARAIDETAYEDLLVTIDDCRQWLKDKGHTPKGTRKADLVAQVLMCDPNAHVLSTIEEHHAIACEGKVILSLEDWSRVVGAAEALECEPAIQRIMEKGNPEVAVFGECPDTGVPLKARMDWVAPDCILDLKTFAQQRGRSIDKSVNAAIVYEGYYRQGAFYSKIDGLATGKKPRPFVLAFVESVEPHEVRIRELLPKCGGEPNLYWMTAMLEIRELTRTYAECWQRFGTDPWREDRSVDPLLDAEMPQLSW